MHAIKHLASGSRNENEIKKVLVIYAAHNALRWA